MRLHGWDWIYTLTYTINGWDSDVYVHMAYMGGWVDSSQFVRLLLSNPMHSCSCCSAPPGHHDSRLLERYNPLQQTQIQFGAGSKVGRGGMQAKVGAAEWAWQQGVGVVICNGNNATSIRDVLAGRRVGTFFAEEDSAVSNVEDLAHSARVGSRALTVTRRYPNWSSSYNIQ